ncbi:ProQ/FINO family protein [Escherichia coli]
MTTLTLNHKRGDKKSRIAQPDKTTTAHKTINGHQNTPEGMTKKSSTAISAHKMTKQKRKNRRRLLRLVELWPDVFSMKDVRPLKKGIHEDLLRDADIRALPVGRGTLLAGLKSYVSRPRYLVVLSSGGNRYDMQGNEAGYVTTEEQEDARRQLEILNNRRNWKNSECAKSTG